MRSAENGRGMGDAQERVEGQPGREAIPLSERIARDLSGDLACVGCGYNLRGMSVRGECPECGLGVLATVLHVIDPQAEQLQEIPRRRLVAGGMVAWAGFALMAAVLAWGIHGVLVLRSFGLRLDVPVWVGHASAVCVLLSGISALVLARPHANIPLRRTLMVGLSTLLGVALMVIHDRLLVSVIVAGRSPFLAQSGVDIERHVLRLIAAVLLSGIILLLRPQARLLAARSVVVRSGRVDRQSMLALLAAVAIAAGGDVLALVAGRMSGDLRDAILPIADILIGMGSLLLTIGLGGILLDTLRLAPVILHPAPGVREAFDPSRSHFEGSGDGAD